MDRLKIAILTALILSTSLARADIIDFVKLTQDGTDGLGESAWSTLKLDLSDFSVDITATKTGVTAPYAYLDWNHAGLGVCGAAGNNNGQPNTERTGSSSNICNPGSDDNVTNNEALHFVFNRDVTINRLWLNNTHDPDRNILGPDDYVLINGQQYAGPGNGYAPTTNYSGYDSSVNNFLSSFSVAAGETFTVAFGNQQFYISGMEVSVPEPGTLSLLALGLFGLGLTRRRRG